MLLRRITMSTFTLRIKTIIRSTNISSSHNNRLTGDTPPPIKSNILLKTSKLKTSATDLTTNEQSFTQSSCCRDTVTVPVSVSVAARSVYCVSGVIGGGVVCGVSGEPIGDGGGGRFGRRFREWCGWW
jgi:hypothetical protein